MKKLLISACTLSVLLAGVSFAATTSSSTTYTEKFIQKHTQGVVNKEKELRAKNDAQKAKIEAAKKADAEKKAKYKAKYKTKKDALNTLLSK